MRYLAIIVIVSLVFLCACAAPQPPVPIAPAQQITAPVQAVQSAAYDLLITLTDNTSAPASLILDNNHESVLKLVNNRSTPAVFEIPQLAIYEKLLPQETRYVSILPATAGYYQMKLNNAPYSVFQVR